ncbi:c-type cytochrome [Ferruginibacter sp.]
MKPIITVSLLSFTFLTGCYTGVNSNTAFVPGINTAYFPAAPVSRKNSTILYTKDTAQKTLSGEKMYKMNCASCHFPKKDFVGPMLAGCRQREPDKDWAYRFINNAYYMQENDPYAKALLKKYKSRHLVFKLSKKELNAILDYCDSYLVPVQK